MGHPDEDERFEDDCSWYPYHVVSRSDESGERREQRWYGRNANHALERAHAGNPVLFEGPMTEVKATRDWD